jgi:PAS domain S-box-containing protein
MASVTHPDEPLGFELFELLPDAIIAVDRQGVIRYANRQAARLFGQDRGTLVSTPVEAVLPEHLRERHIVHRAKYTSEPRMRPMGAGLDLVAQRADGTRFPVDIMLNPLTHLAEPMVLAVVRNVTERRAAEEALRQSEARLAAIVTSSADAIISKTLGSIVTSWNEAAERMFGYSADEIIGQSIRRLIPADRQPEEDMILARLARNECIVRFETVGLAKDGRTFDTSVTISPMRNAEGHIIGASKIVRDISEHKRREEERRDREEREHLLMREVNHRAKNMLSLVQAIARQSAAREPEDFVRRFTERIQALAANQDLLIRHEWHGVDVKDLVRAQLAHFADLVGSRIAVHGPKLRLNAAAAEGIGLALHELATNAGKYGALSTDAGHVDIGWGTDGDAFTMSWTEREGPPVSAPQRRGFGTVVLETMAERSVNGAADLRYRPSGLTWRLTCPAANALEGPSERERAQGTSST